MLRRHAAGLRALLMLTDGLLAAVLLVVLSVVRLGPDWAVWWRQIVPDPVALLVVYSAGWVASLALNGLYRPRARWSIRSEAGDLLRATALMALATLSVLFWFKLPDVSRVFLLILFPTQYVVTLLTRAVLRLVVPAASGPRHEPADRRHRRCAGPAAQAFAAKLEAHRELGLRVVGFVDDDPAIATGAAWPVLGRLEDLERLLHERVIDEVAICLPFSQWRPRRRDRPPRRGGGQDRPRPDGCPRPRLLGRQGGGARRHAGVSRSSAGPIGPSAWR